MAEDTAVKTVYRALGDRYYANQYGDGHVNNGVPDIFTLDKEGTFTGIECKDFGKEPVFTQLENGLRILESGGRFIVGYADFDVSAFDNKSLPRVTLPSDYEELAIFKLKDKKHTQEFVLEEEDVT